MSLPLYSNFGILDPRLAIAQAFNRFEFCNNSFGLFSQGWDSCWNNWNDFGCWNNWNSAYNCNYAPASGSGSGNSAGNTPEAREYNTIRQVLNKVIAAEKKGTINLSDTVKDEIDEALHTKGSMEEKLTAVKNVYNKLNKADISTVICEDTSVKAKLESIGYINDDTYTEKVKDAAKKFGEQDVSALNALAAKDTILKLVSTWNDCQNGNIISRLTEKYKIANDSNKDKYKSALEKVTNSLVNKGKSSDAQGTKDLATELEKTLNNVTNNSNNTDEQYNSLKKAFNDLYIRLRLEEAQKLKEDLKTKTYKDLNDDKVLDEIITKTKADLKKEGFKDDAINAAVKSLEKDKQLDEAVQNGNPKVIVEELTRTGVLEKVNGQNNVFKTADTGDGPAKFYTYANGGQDLVELEGVESIDAQGNCKMLSGEEKSINDVRKVETSRADIKKYQRAAKKFQKVDTTKFKNENKNAFVRYYVKNNKNIYIVICNNKLMKLKPGYFVNINGNIYNNNNEYICSTNHVETHTECVEEIDFNDII